VLGPTELDGADGGSVPFESDAKKATAVEKADPPGTMGEVGTPPDHIMPPRSRGGWDHGRSPLRGSFDALMIIRINCGC